MRKKVISGLAVLILGTLLTGVGVATKFSLSADTIVSSGTVKIVGVCLFSGIALILLSAILFIQASGDTKKE